MNFIKEQQRYIELVALDRVFCSYENVAIALGNKALEKQISAEYSKKGGIVEWLADEIFGKNDNAKFDKLQKLKDNEILQKEIEKIDKIFSHQYSSNAERKKGFGSFKEFYYCLFMDGEPKCFYCDITQTELNDLFDIDEKLDEKERQIKSKKFGATLHIEKLDPDKPYCKDNCRLACAVCNNAKSDLISEDDFKECFAEAVKKFYSILKARLEKAKNSKI